MSKKKAEEDVKSTLIEGLHSTQLAIIKLGSKFL